MTGAIRDSHETIVLSLLAKRFRTPYSKAGDFSLAPDPRAYSKPFEFSQDYLLYNYLRKSLKGTLPGITEKTHEAWLLAERQCFATNQRLNKVADNFFFERVRENIVRVIGYEPTSKIVGLAKWSNGATALTKRGVHHSLKMKGVVAVTDDASRHIPYFFEGMSGYGLGHFELNRSNRCVQVPKTASINRTISCENAANSYMQQSVGQFIRKRLLRVGLDLNDQSNNQRAAFCAAADELATIDLSMASDTLALSLVRLCLPTEWFNFLNSLRSKFSHFTVGEDEHTYLLEKFSSMGNAFTFELETLIFWAIAYTVTSDPNLLVYGDDIICRQADSALLIQALTYCGFVINRDKSFTDGLFFESCGKHYHTLEDVTPVFQKEIIDTNDVLTLYRAHNRLYRWGLRNELKLVLNACKYLVSLIPQRFQLWIPVCERDDGLITVVDQLLHRDSNGDYLCRVVVSKKKIVYDVDELLAYGYNRKTGRTNELPNGRACSDQLERPPKFYKVRRCVIWATSVTLDYFHSPSSAPWLES